MSRCWKRRSRKCMSLVGVSSARQEAHSQIKTTMLNAWCARLSEVLMTGDVYKNRSSSFVFFYIASLSLRHQNVDKNFLCGLQAHDIQDMSVCFAGKLVNLFCHGCGSKACIQEPVRVRSALCICNVQRSAPCEH